MEKGHGDAAVADDSASPPDATPPPCKSMGWMTKAKGVAKMTTVEPIAAFYFMPSILASLATQNLNLEKACYVNLRYDETVCQALSSRQTANYTLQEVAVQQLVANMMTWKNVVQASIPAMMIMFLGTWSDRHRRRKPLMLIPVVGEFLTCVGLIVCTRFFYELPMEVGGVVEGVFPAITGGWCTMFMAIYSYIGDITTVSMRTVRIGLVSLFVHVGIPVGMALSGVLYKVTGFYGVFSTSAVLYVIVFAYILLRIKDKKRKPIGEASGETATAVAQTGCCASAADCVHLEHVATTLRSLNRFHGRQKAKLVMVMICGMLVIGPIHGEMAVMYLFTRYRFNWNEVDFSIFSTYSMVTNLLGTMVSVGVFSHMLKIDDALIGVMSCMSKILSCFVYAFATTTWMIYLAPIVEILNGTSFIAMRSIISKLVPPDELGKVNSLFGVCEALMPLVYGPMYSAVYTSTIHTLPGAFFLLGGALTLPAVLMFLWMYMVHKQELKRLSEEQAVEAGDGEKTSGDVAANTFVPPSITEDGDLKKTTASPGVVNKAYDAGSDESECPPPDFAEVVPDAPAANGQVNNSFELCDEKL